MPDFSPKQAKGNIIKKVKYERLDTNKMRTITLISLVINVLIYWSVLDIELTHKYYIINYLTFHSNIDHHTDTIYE